ncbi:hypothetical protein P3T35_000117 [Kitasatospora sp. GP30]|nr:hypothetical protein [Kitasatospora sp. GP30]
MAGTDPGTLSHSGEGSGLSRSPGHWLESRPMAENNYEDNAGNTQMFRAFVETPPAQERANVSVHRSSSGGGGRTGMIAFGAIVAVVVVVAVVWLAVK